MLTICPYCQNLNITSKSFYRRKSDGRRVRRYSCRRCGKTFSEQTVRPDYRLRKRRINTLCFRLLGQGMSQRAVARTLAVKPAAVALRVERFGCAAKQKLEHYRRRRSKLKTVLIDEMESFEHTKCKPLTMPIAVEDKTRKIIALEVGAIAAKGHLAKISRKKYGHRRCERSKVLEQVFSSLSQCCEPDVLIKSDQSSHYPPKIKTHFPAASHQSTRGRRGCVVGQGELKAGGFDPLFSLNHTYAMIRCGLKRLSRRTWCTTKLASKLRHLLYIFAWFHNCRLDRKKALPSFRDLIMTTNGSSL